jgi:hypothetical protein
MTMLSRIPHAEADYSLGGGGAEVSCRAHNSEFPLSLQ